MKIIDRIKSFASYIFGFVVFALAALLVRERRAKEKAQSETASAKATKEIAINETQRQIAKTDADSAVAEYNRLRGEQ